MKVKFGMSWDGNKPEYFLEDLLTPNFVGYESIDGQIEDLENRNRKVAESFGRLLAYMVEKNIVPLEAAVSDICMLYGEVEEIDSDS